jgi:hypothetical protein
MAHGLRLHRQRPARFTGESSLRAAGVVLIALFLLLLLYAALGYLQQPH